MQKERQNVQIETVRRLVEDFIVHEGMELVLVEMATGPQGRILRLVIDKPGGVTLDDCVHVSRTVSDILDVHDPIPESYNLEVTSPGINRPLVGLSDYERFAGERVVLKTRQPFQSRKRFKGILRRVEDGAVVVETMEDTYAIPFDIIAKGRLDKI